MVENAYGSRSEASRVNALAGLLHPFPDLSPVFVLQPFQIMMHQEI
ncbi:hypothetical protein Rahaq_4496 (plasmid) [Rahnella aceris]|jgi:hypothetical protein|uniref:Uncharacterized protein n=1 Tax=Rahnella sp. (strain Y9602) TaxID=2703885 RepID=A0A0H3FGX7_RAHSY|nr:hypothetical protein Rahaq_4496 [Rahnella aceris]